MKIRGNGRLVQEFDPSQTRHYHSDAIQTTSRCSVTDADEIVSQLLDDEDSLGLLNRSNVLGNQNGLLRFGDDTAVRLIS